VTEQNIGVRHAELSDNILVVCGDVYDESDCVFLRFVNEQSMAMVHGREPQFQRQTKKFRVHPRESVASVGL
jgi:hypothetical protein